MLLLRCDRSSPTRRGRDFESQSRLARDQAEYKTISLLATAQFFFADIFSFLGMMSSTTTAGWYLARWHLAEWLLVEWNFAECHLAGWQLQRTTHFFPNHRWSHHTHKKTLYLLRLTFLSAFIQMSLSFKVSLCMSFSLSVFLFARLPISVHLLASGLI